jgi:uncharacterized protein (TIGR02594 family)
MSGPDKPPSDAIKQRQPFPYQVQPGDTLAGIAKRFNTSVDQIKQDNHRFNDKLFAGEMLSIYGPKAEKEKPVKAVKQKVFLKQPNKADTEPPAPKPPVVATPTLPARSDEGEGKPLALLPADQRRAPWMVYAIAEAKRLKGMTEDQIEASGTNYHKALKDGVSTMVGDLNAWCAAFANWCLCQAGYPIDTKGGWAARARGVYSHDTRDEKGQPIQNPLFIQIQNPIYGCLALVTKIKNDLGKHIGFVYAQEDEKTLIILGGNQSNRINFTATPKEAQGKRLLYFVPASYQNQAFIDKNSPLEIKKSDELNKEFNISIKSTNPGDDR